MNIVKSVFIAAAVCAFSLSGAAVMAKDEAAKTGAAPKAGKDYASKVSSAVKAVREIAVIPKRKIPPVLFKEAAAVVIVPKASKTAFMVKGGSNSGLLLLRDKAGAWSSPVFITISGGTLGWQMAGDPMDIIMLFRNSTFVEAVLKGKLILDAKVDVVPGKVAPTMKGASDAELKAGITSYIRSHGEFAEDSVVAGTTIQLDSAANDSFYGTAKVAAADIVSGKVVRSGEDLKALQKVLAEYAAAK